MSLIKIMVNIKRIDVEVLKNILNQLKAFNKTKMPLSDISTYMKINSKDVKAQMELLNTNFQVQNEGRRTYISLRV